MARSCLAVVFAACGLLPAQSLLVAPGSHAALEGTGSTNVPFGRSTPTRVQYVYDAMLFAAPATITAIAFRLDGLTAAAAKAVDCELRLSTLPSSLVGVSADFAANRGADETVVLPRQIVTLPAGTAVGAPNAFLPPIPLATPFAYNPAQGGLVLEIVVHGQPPGAYTLDATYVCSSPDLPVGPTSCVGSNGLPLRVASSSPQVMWGQPWTPLATQAQPGALVVLALGTMENGNWAGLPLPFDLQPVGAPGCWLSIDVAGSWAGVAASNGACAFPFTLPNTPAAIGAWLRFQAAAFDAGANALGLVTSQAQKAQVCGFEPVARVWSGGVTATTGARETGVAAVVRFTVQ
jgi:hypothetical protein